MLLKTLIPQISTLIPYEYSQIQSPLYDELIFNLLQKAPATKNSTFCHMFGIPGAGKSTFYHSRNWPQHVLVSFDAIMESLPGYQKDLSCIGPAASFQKWEIPARIIGYELLRQAVESRKNIFFDHGGATPAHLDLLKNARNHDYNIQIYYIRCHLENALKHAEIREKIMHRHTPPQMIKQRYQIIASLAEEYQKAADAFYAYDNTPNGFIFNENLSKQPLPQYQAA